MIFYSYTPLFSADSCRVAKTGILRYADTLPLQRPTILSVGPLSQPGSRDFGYMIESSMYSGFSLENVPMLVSCCVNYPRDVRR